MCPELPGRVRKGQIWSKMVEKGHYKKFYKKNIKNSINIFSLKTGPEGSEATPAPLRTRGSVRKNLTKIQKIIKII